MKKKNDLARGFTLIEIILVIAIVLIISVPTASFYSNFMYRSAVRDASDTLKGALGEARNAAMSGKAHCSWGVKYQSSSIIIFCGDSYSGRDSKYDTVFALNNKLDISGLDELVFAYPSGLPNETLSNISIAWGNGNQKTFSINEEGSIQ